MYPSHWLFLAPFAVAGSSLSKSYIDVVFKVKEKRCFRASIVAHAGNQAGDAVSCVWGGCVCVSECTFVRECVCVSMYMFVV